MGGVEEMAWNLVVVSLEQLQQNLRKHELNAYTHTHEAVYLKKIVPHFPLEFSFFVPLFVAKCKVGLPNEAEWARAASERARAPNSSGPINSSGPMRPSGLERLERFRFLKF